ncbi:hypothetical protein [uncultured Paludibaculum sp.]|uniref:hypothetical protein n=1 Tax=uncultured Paludibaculum sp. TaxID=1765020 RepID=UPI002AAB038B|nr:hypothetical protein [uncultured Paludibaculum sp.]
MTSLQFRILHRQFLFRVVDLEVLSPQAQGDANRLLGQFAAMLVLVSAFLSLVILGMGGTAHETHSAVLHRALGLEHLLISTTMLVVGLFAVLSWESAFPDRRDVLVLGPLPVSPSTMFLAKASASAMALGVAVAALNGLPSFAWALSLSPPGYVLLDLILAPEVYRTFLAYWLTVGLAGALVYGTVLCLQAVASGLLRRWLFLRASAPLQMGCFLVLVIGYFVPSPDPGYAPSQWFLALFQQMLGATNPAEATLAHRAWMALGLVGMGTTAAYLSAYVKSVRGIAEEPEIVPGWHAGLQLPSIGAAFSSAVVQFSLRALARSRQHRLLMAFYVGVGFAITILYMKTPAMRQYMGLGLPASSVVLLIAWMVGLRAVFSIPLDLRANWMFRMMPLPGAGECLAARRTTLLVLGAVPVWVVMSCIFLSVWPWRQALFHGAVLGLLSLLLVEVGLRGRQKLPFTCSWLPGRSQVHITFWLSVGLVMNGVIRGVQWEMNAMRSGWPGVWLLAGLVAAVVLVWRRLDAEGEEIHFEEEETEVQNLGLCQ